ncbi:hypothetical protein BDU57DRAFT_597734 [Ampelomyces quisqualis]|uniref:Uncharacterized protein n=1 Tax=Ampelomyces quisqualis TaxID=50730 RepID=A0A6A5QEW1_AMPQU|nr:hypothetical protein BDU57DRAFT_597734 [Ampelomyces quisqualis]
MCRVEERVYISAEGHRSKFEDTFPCDKARGGRLCANVKKRTTEYYPKKAIAPRNDTPSPINPPTPTGPGTYLVQQRRPSSSSGQPVSRDRPKSIVIEFGAKNTRGSKYAEKRTSLGASSGEDVAIESPSSDASHTVRTGYPDTRLPPHAAGFVHLNTYNTTPTISHGYHHRHTSSSSSYTGSSRTPSLYVTSDPDYDSPTNTTSTRPAPTIHNSTSAGTSSAIYNLAVVTPHGYQDYAVRSGSSYASSGTSGRSRKGKDPKNTHRKRDSDCQRHEEMDCEDDARAKEENIKQVRFELNRAESRTKERNETLIAVKEKQCADDREEARRHKGKEREREREEQAVKSRGKQKPVTSSSSSKLPAESRRGSMSHTMTPAQQEEHRRLLAAELGHVQGESRATEAREQQERAALLLQEQEKSSYWSPRAGSSMHNNTGLIRRDSLSHRGNVSNDARPVMHSRSNNRRASISQPNPPSLNTLVPQASGQTRSTRTHAPPPVSFPVNFNPRARRPSFTSQDPTFAGSNRLSGSFENPFTPVVPAPLTQSAVTIHQDPWDARNMRQALPAPRHSSDERYTLQRRALRDKLLERWDE